MKIMSPVPPSFLNSHWFSGRVNVKQIALGKKEHTADKTIGGLGFIGTFHTQ